MTTAFEIGDPLPARGSAIALRRQLLAHLERIRPQVGDRFMSDHELTRIAGISRPTVRRALDDLQREGWIERRPGIGTFIGPRASLWSDQQNHSHNGGSRRTIRLALLVHLLGDLLHDWYVAGLIAGIDSAAEETGVSLELLGHRDGEVAAATRRLEQSRPDVLAFAAPAQRHAILFSEARRLNIPCIGTGTFMPSIGLPAVCEDGEDGACRAVQHLVAHGHRKIGFVTPTFALPWVFQRRKGYLKGLEDTGLDPDEGMVLWLENHEQPDAVVRLQRYLDRRQPTALLLSSWVLLEVLSPLIQSGKIVVPRDLSVISFDQHQTMSIWLGNVKPTTVNMPLMEMGRRLAHMARQVLEHKPVESALALPCPLIEGDSVAPPRSV